MENIYNRLVRDNIPDICISNNQKSKFRELDDLKYVSALNEELKEETKGKTNYRVQRYKGLGEMNASQLWETTMNPEERKLIKVNITDAALAEKRVSVLMGDSVSPRKTWIEENVVFSLEDDYKIA